MNSLRMCVRCSRASCSQRWREMGCWLVGGTVIFGVYPYFHYAFFLGAFVMFFSFAL